MNELQIAAIRALGRCKESQTLDAEVIQALKVLAPYMVALADSWDNAFSAVTAWNIHRSQRYEQAGVDAISELLAALYALLGPSA